MASLIIHLLSPIRKHLTTALAWVLVRANTPFPIDLEHGNADNMDTTSSSVPSDFSFNAESEIDFPPCLDQPPRTHHGLRTLNGEHIFLLDAPNLYWTQETIANWASELGASDCVHRRWCVATRKEYYKALQL